MKLYEIDDAIQRAILDGVDRETGEMSEVTFENLGKLQMEFNDKALAVLAYAKGELAEADAIRAYGDSIKEKAQAHYDRADSHERRAKGLLGYIDGLYPKDAAKIEDARGSLARQLNNPACEIVDESAIPAQFMATVPATKKPDKKAIIEHYKESKGQQVSGTHVSRKSRLVYK